MEKKKPLDIIHLTVLHLIRLQYWYFKIVTLILELVLCSFNDIYIVLYSYCK